MVVLLRTYDRGHDSPLPFKYLKRLAREVAGCGELPAQEQIEGGLARLHEQWEAEKTELARKLGYYPLVQFTLDTYRYLGETYGDWALELMARHLDEPARIFPKWAAQFAAAMSEIGRQECEKHPTDLYQFVTGHQAWQRNADARNKMSEALIAARLQKMHHPTGQ